MVQDLEAIGAWKAVVVFLDFLLAENPPQLDFSPWYSRRQALAARGAALFAVGEGTKAAVDLEQAVKLGATHNAVWLQAVAAVSTAIEREPQRAKGWFLRGTARLRLSQWQQAIDDITQAEKLGSQGWAVFWNRAVARVHLDDLPNAIADFAHVVDREPDDVEAYQALALAQLADERPADYRRTCATLYQRLSNSKKADDQVAIAWTATLDANSRIPPARLVDLARAGIKNGRRDVGGMLTLGAALDRAGDYEEARQQLEAAARDARDTQATFAALLLARTQYHLQQKKEARALLQTATRWLEQHAGQLDWLPRLELRVLRREVARLLDEEK